MKRANVGTVGLLLGTIAVAQAQDLPRFEEIDSNADGQISREEAVAVEGLIFVIVDADQNGSLSREEWTAAGGQ